MCDECGKVMRADNYTRHTRVHKSEDISVNGIRVETHLRKYGNICNPSAPKSTVEQDENIEIEVKTVVNSLVNTVVGILDGDGEILNNDDKEQEEEHGSKRVTSGIMSIDEREELEKELIREKNIFEKTPSHPAEQARSRYLENTNFV